MGKNNNAIQILRGTRDAIAGMSETLLPGQLLYNMTDNYITAGKADAEGRPEDTSIDSAPITVRELHGWTGDANGIAADANKGIQYGIECIKNSDDSHSLNIIGPGELSLYSGNEDYPESSYTNLSNSYTEIKLGKNMTLESRSAKIQLNESGGLQIQGNSGNSKVNLTYDAALESTIGNVRLKNNNGSIVLTNLGEIQLTGQPTIARTELEKIELKSDKDLKGVFKVENADVKPGLYEFDVLLEFDVGDSSLQSTLNTTFLVSIKKPLSEYINIPGHILGSIACQIDSKFFTLGIMLLTAAEGQDEYCSFCLVAIDGTGLYHPVINDELTIFFHAAGMNGDGQLTGTFEEYSWNLASRIELTMTALFYY